MRTRGFTLIEMMAVILMLALISTLVAVNVMDRVEWARVQTTKVKMRALEGNLEMFRLDQRDYPTTDQGLIALVERPSVGVIGYYPESGYVKDREALDDAWSRPFGYESPGERARGAYDLWSNGRDGLPGGDGVDADIVNWEESG